MWHRRKECIPIPFRTHRNSHREGRGRPIDLETWLATNRSDELEVYLSVVSGAERMLSVMKSTPPCKSVIDFSCYVPSTLDEDGFRKGCL
eukprot:5592199-Amphidinium_carterae.1